MANTYGDVLSDKLKVARRKHVESMMTHAGGYTRKDLASIGVNWPPLKGWKQRYIDGLDPNKEPDKLTDGEGI